MKNFIWIAKFSAAVFSLSILFFSGVVEAAWLPPAQNPPGFNTMPAINIGSSFQIKPGPVVLGSADAVLSARIGYIGIGETPALTRGASISATGNVLARRFCLGSIPSATNGCISSWQDVLGLSGGQANSLVRWTGSNSIGPSSISESGNNFSLGSPSDPKTVTLNGTLNTDSKVSGKSGLSLTGLSGLSVVQISGLAKSNGVLYVDSGTGEIKLGQACGQTISSCTTSTVLNPNPCTTAWSACDSTGHQTRSCPTTQTNADCTTLVGTPITQTQTCTTSGVSGSYSLTNLTINGTSYGAFLNNGQTAPVAWVADGADYYEILGISCKSGVTIKRVSDGANLCNSDPFAATTIDKNLSSIDVKFINGTPDLQIMSLTLSAIKRESSISRQVGFYLSP